MAELLPRLQHILKTGEQIAVLLGALPEFEDRDAALNVARELVPRFRPTQIVSVEEQVMLAEAEETPAPLHTQDTRSRRRRTSSRR